MSYLTFNDLTQRTFSQARSLNENIRTKSNNDVTVFLSYRREDRNWVDPIVRFLKQIGVSVYIDYLDQTLDDGESNAVASTLRDRIKNCKKFVSLLTPNAGKSKWMPWELGLGDRIVNYPNVAILPLTTYSNLWANQEYGKIYGRIEKLLASGFSSDQTWYIIFPDGTRELLKNWLLK